ncbi:MAG: NrsF family protein [Gammaproteobacteria bacterium]
MNNRRDALIRELGDDLTPVSRPGRVGALVALWLCVAFVLTAAALGLTGELRPGALGDLGRHPRFLLESVVGLLAVAALAGGGLGLAVPAPGAVVRRAAVPLALLAAWAGFYVLGLADPALPQSMAGKRAGCWYETALFGLPALGLGLLLARRLYPLHGAWTGTLIGLAAGAVPALMMQFACMYVPQHILMHHLLPGLLLGPVGALGGWLLLRQR